MPDDFAKLIDELLSKVSSDASDIVRLQALVVAKTAEKMEKNRRQIARAIVENLKTQRMIREAIGRPRNKRGSHGKAKSQDRVDR